MKKIKVGIIGCGAIGSEIVKVCVGSLKEKIELTALYDIDKERISNLLKVVGKIAVANSIDDLFDKSELIIEAASTKISEGIVKKAIETSKDAMIMSVGGLINSEKLLKDAVEKNVKLYFPSGAISGIDALKAAKLSKIEKVTLTTKKPPRGLEGAPYLKEKNINVNNIKTEEVIFEGSALEAVKGFPKNVNVSSLLSLTGIGAKNTTVKIVTSPEFKTNTHKIEITGEFGKITTETQNVPSKKNPKTSALAFFSAIATLKGITESVRLGT